MGLNYGRPGAAEPQPNRTTDDWARIVYKTSIRKILAKLDEIELEWYGRHGKKKLCPIFHLLSAIFSWR
jgi:hypothetical protein